MAVLYETIISKLLPIAQKIWIVILGLTSLFSSNIKQVKSI